MNAASISPADQAARRAEQEKARGEILAIRHKLALAFAEVFGEEGKRTERQQAVMKNIREVCCLDASTIDDRAAIDANRALLLEGRRQIGLHIVQLIEAAVK